MKKNFLKKIEKYYWAFFVVAIFLIIVSQYFGLVYYNYAVPPGHDGMMHWYIAKPLFDGIHTPIEFIKSAGYPPLYHVLLSGIAHLLNADMIKVMLWGSPMIIVAGSLSVYLLSSRLFGRWSGLVSMAVYGLLTPVVIQQLNDGGYPNLIAAQILLPLLLLSVHNFFRFGSRKYYWVAIFLLLAALIFYTHHIVSLYILFLFAVAPPVCLLIGALQRKKYIWVLPLLVFSVCFWAGLFCLLFFTDIFSSARGLASATIEVSKAFPFIKIVGVVDPESIVKTISLPGYTGLAPFFLGTVGILSFALDLVRLKKISAAPVALVLLSILLFAGSRLNIFSNPDRLARDLAMPLAVFSGLGLIQIVKMIAKRNQKILGMVLLIVAVATISKGAYNKLKSTISYEPMVRVTSADMQAVNYLKNQPAGIVLVEGYNFYLPAFLPGWNVRELWVPQTYQDPLIHILDPKDASDAELLKSYDYIYIVDQQKGWAPSAITFNFAWKYLDDTNFELVGRYQSPVNTVYLLRVVK